MRIDGWRSSVLLLPLVAALSCSSDPPASDTRNFGVGMCPAGSMACGGVCTDITSSSNCGGCGRACGGGMVCSMGTCAVTCGPGLTLCGTSCVSGPCGGPGSPIAGGGPIAGESGAGALPGAGSGPIGSDAGNGPAGTSSGGGAGGTSGMAGAAGSAGPPGAFGGYITSGAWKGFAWTATSPNGGTIMPADYAAAFDFPLCARGSVMAGDANVAMVGWNINQSTEMGAAAMSVTPELGGVTVRVTNPGGSELRLQLQGPSGATSASDRWCAVIPGTGGFIPFDAFNTECWSGGMGMSYRGQPLVAAIVLVPGRAGAPVAFDFCIDALAETDESGMASTGCSLSGSPGEGGGTISGTDTRVVTRGGRQYVVQNNVWNGNSNNQTLSVSGTSFTVMQQSNSAGTNGPPASYPSVFIGSNFGHASSGSGLPRRVSSLSSVQTGWRWSGGNGTYNAAYDVWFSTGAGGDASTPSGGYLMVWFARAGVQPLGSPSGTVSIGGRSFQVWTCPGGCQNGVPVISYIPPSGSINEWSFDLNDFIQNAVTQFNIVRSDWYLSNVFAGFEIWSGGTGLRSENFCAVVQ
jgi:hypothetical protein